MAFSSEEWPKGKLQTVRIWSPGKFPSFCTGVLKMYNFVQIPLAILVDWAVFRTFQDFTKMWTRWNFESIFLKIVHQKGLFDTIKENPNFPSCRGILDIYRQWLLNTSLTQCKRETKVGHFFQQIHIMICSLLSLHSTNCKRLNFVFGHTNLQHNVHLSFSYIWWRQVFTSFLLMDE